jgi:hypothetical protein
LWDFGYLGKHDVNEVSIVVVYNCLLTFFSSLILISRKRRSRKRASASIPALDLSLDDDDNEKNKNKGPLSTPL